VEEAYLPLFERRIRPPRLTTTPPPPITFKGASPLGVSMADVYANRPLPVTVLGASRALGENQYVIYEGTDLFSTIDAMEGTLDNSFCVLPETANSRYKFNGPEDHDTFWPFLLTTGGQTLPTYCLDHTKHGAYGDIPFQSAPAEVAHPGITIAQKNEVAWVIANTYPAVSAADTFAMVGVDAGASPSLDENDAWAAVQLALWFLLGQIPTSYIAFMDCNDPSVTHVKNDRLAATTHTLIAMAQSHASVGALPTGTGFAAPQMTKAASCSTSGRCGGSSDIVCCNPSTPPDDPSAPYILFEGCPDELRVVCGRLLIGPFKIVANVTGAPSISFTPFCSCDGDFTATFMDFCGNRIPTPGIGEEFYIALRDTCGPQCFTISVSIDVEQSLIVFWHDSSGDTGVDRQPFGTGWLKRTIHISSSICVCVQSPRPEPEPPPPPGMNINNNNNNNSNSSNNNNLNNNTSIRHETMMMLLLMMSGGINRPPITPVPPIWPPITPQPPIWPPITPVPPIWPPITPQPPIWPPQPPCPPGWGCMPIMPPPFPPKPPCPPGPTFVPG